MTAGRYSLLLNHWGLSDATSGYGCAALTSLSSASIAWSNSWAWEGDNKIKSYTNMQLNEGLNKRLSAIKRMQVCFYERYFTMKYPFLFSGLLKATWSWSQTSSGSVVSNVAYDLFTSSTPGGENLNEIMIWLADLNAGPISAAYHSDGTAIPIVADIALAGYTWYVIHSSNIYSQIT